MTGDVEQRLRGRSNASGIYTILVPAGSYTATAADPDRNCTSASPPSPTVAPPGGGTVTQNFAMTGTSKLEANGFTIDDSLGNNNGIVNRAECVNLNLGVKNNGCATETAISATLTTTTPGVTIVDGNSSYSDMLIDESGTNTTPFKISVCGHIRLRHRDRAFAQPHLREWKQVYLVHRPDLRRRSGSDDPAQPDSRRVIRRRPIGLAGMAARAPAPARSARADGFPGTHRYETFTFTNTSGAPRCYTVTINAELGGPGDIESVAYDQVYDPGQH